MDGILTESSFSFALLFQIEIYGDSLHKIFSRLDFRINYIFQIVKNIQGTFHAFLRVISFTSLNLIFKITSKAQVFRLCTDICLCNLTGLCKNAPGGGNYLLFAVHLALIYYLLK